MVYIKCGHVHGQHDWGIRNRSAHDAKLTLSRSTERRPNTDMSTSSSHNPTRESSSLDLNNDIDLRECPLCRKVAKHLCF